MGAAIRMTTGGEVRLTPSLLVRIAQTAETVEVIPRGARRSMDGRLRLSQAMAVLCVASGITARTRTTFDGVVRLTQSGEVRIS